MVLSVSYFSFTVILSVLSGLENYSLQFSKSFDPEIKVSQKNNQLIILDDSDLDFLSKHENNVTKILKGNVLIKNTPYFEQGQLAIGTMIATRNNRQSSRAHTFYIINMNT